MTPTQISPWRKILKKEQLLLLIFVTVLVLLWHHAHWLGGTVQPIFLLIGFIWLFIMILMGAFAVVRHAGALGILLKEPFGTVILTLSVIAIEVMMITSIMLTGEENPLLARDTMFAVIMIVMNGLVGLTLLIGGWRYREQHLNLQGAQSFLSVIFLMAIIGLVLPNYTHSTPDATLSPFLTIFLICSSLIIYGVFLGIQTVRHRKYFLEVSMPPHASSHREVHYPTMGHVLFLIIYLVLIIFLTKLIAVPINYGLTQLNAPDSFGGVIVAALVLAPEALAAIRASFFNQSQHSVNILLGSVLATISLTIPAVLMVAMIAGQTIYLGLDNLDSTLLFLTLFMSLMTFGVGRTNILQGIVHLLMFFVYLALIFD